jgi:hypothetical protein
MEHYPQSRYLVRRYPGARYRLLGSPTLGVQHAVTDPTDGHARPAHCYTDPTDGHARPAHCYTDPTDGHACPAHCYPHPNIHAKAAH